MTSAVTIRTRAWRRRKNEGRILLHFEIGQDATDTLVDTGLLSEWSTEDPKAIADAIVKLLDGLGNSVPD